MLAEEVVVCPATSADLAGVAGIFAHYVTNTVITFEEIPFTAAQWHDKLNDLTDRGLPFLIARMGGEVAGFAYAAPWRPKPAYRHTVEDSIYLAPDRTGRGLGRVLLSALLTRCTEAGMRQMVAVIADAGGDASVALHRSLGFVTVGRLVGVGRKHGRWVDTVLMQRDLAAGTDQ
jgi:L-amino acid N-acyltransferase YncA